MFFISKEELKNIEREFFTLAYRGTVEALSQFINTEKNVCINACSSVEMGHLTALHYAVWSRDLEKIKLLIRHGSDVNALGVNSKTPIYMLFNKNGSMEDSSENINTIWNYLVYHRAHIPSYNDLDKTEKDRIDDNMAVYQAIFSVLKAISEQRMGR